MFLNKKELADAMYESSYCSHSNKYINPNLESEDSSLLNWPYDFNNTVLNLEDNISTVRSAMSHGTEDYDVSHPIDMVVAISPNKSNSVRYLSRIALTSNEVFEVTKGELDPTYIVRVGNDYYEMDEYPSSPNGVCSHIEIDRTLLGDELDFELIPENIISASIDIFISDSLIRVEKMNNDLSESPIISTDM